MQIEILDPTGHAPARPEAGDGLAPRLAGFEGVKVGFLDNLKPGASHLLGAVRKHFDEKLPVATSYWEKTGRAGSSGPVQFGELLASETGAVINALGD